MQSQSCLLVVIGGDEVDIGHLTNVALVQYTHTLAIVIVPHFDLPIHTPRHHSVGGTLLCGGTILCGGYNTLWGVQYSVGGGGYTALWVI